MVYLISNTKHNKQKTFRPAFHFVETVHLLGLLLIQLASGGPPACIGDPAWIGTSDLEPSFYWRPGFLYETRLVL